MTPRLRRIALTAHVVSSVGWLGAVATVLALGIVALASEDERTVRGAYLTMELAAWYVLVPLSLASLITGVVQGLGTTWGLFEHYWVTTKLLITLVATIVLLMYTQTLDHLADIAAARTVDVGRLRSPSPVVHAAAGLLLLVAATTLAIFKPPGRTRYGWRKRQRLRPRSQS
jgi:uncharacterized membrane protein